MEIVTSESFVVHEQSGIGRVRRAATDLAQRMQLNQEDAGRAAVIASEAATNLVKHAQGGEVVLTPLYRDGARGLALLAVDRGPGIADLDHYLRDGNSSVGTSGNGLGAIRRMSTHFDIYSNQGGTALMACIWARRENDPLHPHSAMGALCVPFPGEVECGDIWAMREDRDSVTILLADGLGHGTHAAAAARHAAETFERLGDSGPEIQMAALHHAMRATRGAAAAIVQIRRDRNTVRYCGVGNIVGAIAKGDTLRHMVSHHGTLGHNVYKFQQFTYPWSHDSLLLMHSDGIGTRWNLNAYPGLAARDPQLTAAVLYRDFRRERDDASIVTLRTMS